MSKFFPHVYYVNSKHEVHIADHVIPKDFFWCIDTRPILAHSEQEAIKKYDKEFEVRTV